MPAQALEQKLDQSIGMLAMGKEEYQNNILLPRKKGNKFCKCPQEYNLLRRKKLESIFIWNVHYN